MTDVDLRVVAPPDERPAPVLTLAAITRTYPGPPQVQALRQVDLTVRHGEYLAITGRSGSGKSTLLNILGLIDQPTSGSYRVLGQESVTLRPSHRDRLRAHTFGFVFQAFHLVPYLTGAENVDLGLTYRPPDRAHRKIAVTRALEQVELLDRAGTPVTELSGGERQRVAIARALVRSPEVLLADEPTGNLDESTAGAILNLFDALHRSGVTIMVVTHDGETAARAHRRVHVRDGVIAEESA